jgi:hypothetical protein
MFDALLRYIVMKKMTAAKKPNQQNQLNKNNGLMAHINLIFSEMSATGCDLT